MRRAAVPLMLSMSASPALAAGLASGSGPDIPWLRLFLAFAFCVALAWGAVVLLRHHQRRGNVNPLGDLLTRRGQAASRRISIIETRRASAHADLCLVECDDETFLLALTAAGATVLKRQSRPEAAR